MSQANVIAEGKFSHDCPTAALVRVLSRVTEDDIESVFAEVHGSVFDLLVNEESIEEVEFEFRGHDVKVDDTYIRVYE